MNGARRRRGAMPAIPKPEPRPKVKARQKRTNQARRNACIDAVFLRDRHVCQKCGTWVYHKADIGADTFNLGHVHEIVLRSLGGSPYDVKNCVLLCNFHHRQIHGLKEG
jgi:hypothetical protein